MSVVDEEWEYPSNISTESFNEFSSRLNILCESFSILPVFKVQNYGANGQNHVDELQSLMEENKNLKQSITSKDEEYKNHKTEYESYKHDQKLLSLGIKDTHEAFLMAKKYYKKFLKVYYTIEKRKDNTQTIFLQFFTESKKDNEKYYVRLIRDTKKDLYDLLETNPKLDVYDELKKNLHKSNDVIGTLCSIRNTFVNIHSSKKS